MSDHPNQNVDQSTTFGRVEFLFLVIAVFFLVLTFAGLTALAQAISSMDLLAMFAGATSVVVSAATAMSFALAPFSQNAKIDAILVRLVALLEKVLHLLRHSVISLTIAFSAWLLLGIPFLVSFNSSWARFLSRFSTDLLVYVYLNVALILVTLGTGPLSEFILKYLDLVRRGRGIEFGPRLQAYAITAPSHLRALIYIGMAASYLIYNLEEFAGIQILAFTGWAEFREVIVETLLTFVAADSAIAAWRERNRQRTCLH